MLLRGCWRVSDMVPGDAMSLSFRASGVEAPYRSFMSRAHTLR